MQDKDRGTRAPWYGVRIEVGRRSAAVMSAILGLIGGLLAFWFAPYMGQLIERSNVLGDVRVELKAEQERTNRLTDEMALERTAREHAERQVADLNASSQRMAPYGPSFMFYAQFDLERSRPLTASASGVIVQYEGETQDDRFSFLVTVTKLAAEESMKRQGLTLEKAFDGMPERGIENYKRWPLDEVLIQMPVRLPFERGSSAAVCQMNLRIVLAIESVEKKKLRAGVAITPVASHDECK